LLLRSFGWQATALLLMASIANLSQFAKDLHAHASGRWTRAVHRDVDEVFEFVMLGLMSINTAKNPAASPHHCPRDRPAEGFRRQNTEIELILAVGALQHKGLSMAKKAARFFAARHSF